MVFENCVLLAPKCFQLEEKMWKKKCNTYSDLNSSLVNSLLKIFVLSVLEVWTCF